MGKKRDTGLFERIYNAVTGTGTTVKHGRDFWGRPTRTEHNYDTGVTKKTVSRQGFFGNRDTTKYYDSRGQYAERRGRRSLLLTAAPTPADASNVTAPEFISRPEKPAANAAAPASTPNNL